MPCVPVRPANRGTDMADVSVVLQHENRLIREMLAGHLTREPGITIAGTAPSGPELIQLCKIRRPAVVVFEKNPDAALFGAPGRMQIVGSLRPMPSRKPRRE